MYSNSSEESNVSDYSTESSDEDGMETAQINGSRILLPQGLCDREDVFREFFSQKLWNSLPDEHKTYLQTFLPQFPENDEEEKTITLQRLFNFESFKFSSPLHEFHQQLKAGYFRPDIARMRNIIQKAERKEAKHRYKNHKERLKNAVLQSRKNLLDQLRNLPPGLEPKFDKVDVSSVDLIRHQTKRRYFQILSSIRSKTAGNFSSDENYLGNTTVSLSRKQKRHLNSIKNSLQNCCEQKYCSTLTGKSSLLDLERYITPNSNPFYVNDETYQNLLRTHRKRKQEDPEDPQFNTRNITLTDVIHRTQLPYLKIVQVQTPKNSVSEHRPPYRKKIKKETVYNNYSAPSAPLIPTHLSSNSDNDSDSDSFIDAVTVQPPKQRKSENKVVKAPKIQTIKPIKVEVKEESEDVRLVPVLQDSLSVNTSSNTISPISSYSQYGKIMPVTLSDLEGIDMMNLPIDLDNSNIDILEVNNKPELMQETHSNFLSLLRDIICSTTEHRMDFYALEKRLQTWQESPISPLNDWYSLCESWVRVLQSAINFLCGNATELPNDFVPYLEFKQLINAYQWIGAGRDSDSLLAPLCVFWLEHRDELKTVKQKEEVDIEISDRTQTPPPPRCPTNWTVRKANQESIERFQEQEKRRYENPHRAFTYCCNGYESVVAPLKGIYNPSVGSAKARGHTILTTDRPNFVTILSLVRDATARLPNGEGTRGDIAELLKYSQYISPTATDSVLQTVVSGALDRMHTQFDPCVKYEAKRKIWIYLHRNRSEEDFEKIHQHLQGVAKIPKKAPKKSSTKKVKQLNKMKSTKESNTTLENVSDKTKATKKSSPMLNAALSPALVSPKSNSLLISNNIQQQREPSPPTIQILETVPSSPSKMQEEQEINEALQAIVENRISSPKLSKPKNVVKILQPSQNKSLVLPSLCTSSQVRHDKMIPAKQSNVQQQMISQQLLQMAGQKQTIQIIQTSEDGDKKSKLPSVFQQQQIIQNVTPQQLQNIKNVTLLRNNSPSATLTSTSDMAEVQSVTVTVNKPIVSMSDQIVQPGIQIKTPNNLTPAQQQQILQTIKQKILPQTMLASQQQQLLLKQKMVQVQKQNQNSSSSISLLGQTTKLNIDTSTSKPAIISTQAPVVAKVLTNAAGQVISVESLLAHQKQHGSLPQGTTLRVSTTKGGQPNIIHLTGTSKQNAIAQFAVASQNNLITLTTQPKLVVATPSTTTMTSTVTSNKTTNRDRTSARNQQLTKIPTKMTQQLINAKIIQNIDGQKLVQPKLIVGQGAQVKLSATSGKNVALQKPTMSSIPTNSNSIRMVNTANLNLTHIGGKPVLLASKGSTIQNLQGQNVILQAQASSSGPSLVLQNSKSLQPSGVTQNASNINIINQQNVVLGSQVKMQQPQVVFKNSNINHVTQSHLVLGGQPVRLHTNNSSTTQRLVLASQGQGGQIVAQQILLPAGFQGTAINIKALQGVKVIPIAQSHGQNRNVQSRQVFARIVNPTISNKTPQNPTVTDKVEEPLSRSDV